MPLLTPRASPRSYKLLGLLKIDTSSHNINTIYTAIIYPSVISESSPTIIIGGIVAGSDSVNQSLTPPRGLLFATLLALPHSGPSALGETSRRRLRGQQKYATVSNFLGRHRGICSRTRVAFCAGRSTGRLFRVQSTADLVRACPSQVEGN